MNCSYNNLKVASLITSTTSAPEFEKFCNSIPGYQLNDDGLSGQRNVLIRAARNGNADLVEYIVKKYGQHFLGFQRMSGDTCALYYIAPMFSALECIDKSKAYETVKRLVDLGADVNESILYGQTPLEVAAKAIENLQIVIFLLKKGATLNQKVGKKKQNIINLAKQEIKR